MPLSSMPLLGRERELTLVRHYLQDERVRLITLTGCLGVGKTRLALQAATELAYAFRGGVVLMECTESGRARPRKNEAQPSGATQESSVESLRHLQPTRPLRIDTNGAAEPVPAATFLARALSVDPSDRATKHPEVAWPSLGAWTAASEEEATLLILDGFERMLGAAMLLGQVLVACPTTKLLVTSRAALRVRWEHEIPLAPLVLPEPLSTERAAISDECDRAFRSPAVALFCDRAKAARPSFALTPENVAAVVAVCRQLDGIPLLLELASARVRGLPPGALMERLAPGADGLPRRSYWTALSGSLRDVPSHQQSLQASLGRSYQLLTPEEQRLLARLGVFAGGCTLDAAQVVCGEEEEAGADIAALLDSLVAHSLAVQEQVSTASAPRFRLLHVVRAYALERLAERGELALLQRRHAAYYSALLERALTRIALPADSTWLAQFEVEQENLQEVGRWAIECEHTAAAQDALRLVLTLCHLWQTHGHAERAESWPVWLAGVATASGDALPAVLQAQLQKLFATSDLSDSALPLPIGSPPSAPGSHPERPRLLLAPPQPDGLSASSASSIVSVSASSEERQRLNRLSCRERDVLRLLAHAKSNKEIAGTLVLSERTIAHHLTSIYNKLGVSSRTAAAALALRAGLTHLPVMGGATRGRRD